MKKSVLTVVLFMVCLMAFSACGSGSSYWGEGQISEAFDDNYTYQEIVEMPFYDVSETPSSYFSLDRNTAAYSLVRRQITDGRKVNEDSVRIEEMINYFDYGYPAPADGEDMKLSAYMTDCPWNAENKLMVIGVKTKEADLSALDSNYVFLVDVSGSMSGSDRLGLVKTGLKELVKNLGENDRVSIVTYANGVDVVLESTPADLIGKLSIINAVDSLNARGSTNGSGGLELAYEIAEQNKEGKNSRVIIMSDGDFNVGITGTGTMTEFIQDKAESGVYLSVLGFGMGNTRDDMLETLARNGNGNYAYIDNETEAVKVLSEELGGTLFTVAKDAKAGVTFTSAVEKYRLIGYDTKYITEEDFENPEKDTGEIGSNLCVTAMYEIKLSESDSSEKLASATVKYKAVSEDETEKTASVDIMADASGGDQIEFAACVAEFGLVLRNSEYKGTASFENVISRLEDLKQYTESDLYKTEFTELVQKAKTLYERLSDTEKSDISE